jgi:hypothetical protein
MRPIACWFGFHDWRRRERTRLGPMVESLERFEQCRRCDKTRAGWHYIYRRDRPPNPKPMAWED